MKGIHLKKLFLWGRKKEKDTSKILMIPDHYSQPEIVSDKKEVLLDSRIHINTLLYESAHTKKEKKLLGKKGWICNPSRLERNR